MAASVLGKRARATESVKESSSISSRVKRRSIHLFANDENARPRVAPIEDNQYHDGPDGLDGLEDPFSSASNGVGKRGVALSPTNTNGHLKNSSVLREVRTTIQIATPQTPRHRDALSKKVPITPRHRVGLVRKALTPCTPRTPLTPSNTPTVYNMARQLFVRSADPGRLIGREEERRQLSLFIQTGIRTKAGRCLYVSGPPGTGKSALVAEVCHEAQANLGVRIASINCMSVKSSKDIYGKLVDDLFDGEQNLEEDQMARLQTIFVPKRRTKTGPIYIVTLDEIDHLLTLDLEISYSLFEWSLNHSSRLVLIGIANALDLTDRFLPRLKARNLKLQLLPFLPYTAPQIASVITIKLKTLSPALSTTLPDYLPFVHPAAVQFCSKKVASQAGDLRKAFDIICRTIDLVETETKQRYQANPDTQGLQRTPSKSPLHENPNLASPSDSPPTLATQLSSLSPTTAPRATIAHIARVCASALSYGGSQRLQTLNLQQKAALCALISLEKANRQRLKSVFATPSKNITAPTVRKLYDTYCGLCKRENALHALTGTEFVDVVGGLEILGLVGEGDMRGFAGGTPGKTRGKGDERRIVSWVAAAEVEGCLEGVGRGILTGLLKGHE